MRFSSFVPLIALVPALLAAPTPSRTVIKRDADVVSAISSAVPYASSLAAQLDSIITRIKSDPLTELDAAGYDIPTNLETAFASAISGIESLPSLPSSSDPTEEVLDDYGPLVRVITESVFYTTIDLKLLVEDTAGEEVPELTTILNAMDDDSYALVVALDVKFQGFKTELADAVGENTVLGQAIDAIGGQLFYLLFDHIAASG